MDRLEFIQTILDMYPESFTEENTERWIDVYMRVLPRDLDFEELLDDMLTNYANTRYAPGTAFFTPYVEKQQKRKQKNNIEDKLKQWEKEREALEKEDKPVNCKVLSPLEVIKKRKKSRYFTEEEMKKLKNYAEKSIPTERLRIEFWREVCSLIYGG